MSSNVNDLLSMVSNLSEDDQQALRLSLSHELARKDAGKEDQYNAGSIDEILDTMATINVSTPARHPSKGVTSPDSSVGSFLSEARSLKGRGSFVRRGKGTEEQDDVFGPVIKQRYTRSDGSAPNSPLTPIRSAAMISNNWRSGGSSDDDNTGSHATQATTPIDGRNAQSHFPPSACVFVANLLSSESEQNLEVAVTKVFKRFGHVYVKIRRDAKNMPFAFCQYTSDSNADLAVLEGKGLNILGRPCRTERSKANLSYFLCRRDGKEFSIEEASKLMKPFGAVESICKYSEEPYTDKNGLLIQFMLFDTGKGALNSLRESSIWQFQQIPKNSSGPITPSSAYKARQLQNTRFLQNYDEERRSIFVGNLPRHADQDVLHGIFRHHGQIISAQVIRHSSNRVTKDVNVFGFVQFADHPSAIRALSQNNTIVDGSIIRVAEKRSSTSTKEHRPTISPVAAPSKHTQQVSGGLVSSMTPQIPASNYSLYNFGWSGQQSAPFTPSSVSYNQQQMVSPPYSGGQAYTGVTTEPIYVWSSNYNAYPAQQYNTVWGTPQQPLNGAGVYHVSPGSLVGSTVAYEGHSNNYPQEHREITPTRTRSRNELPDEEIGGAPLETINLPSQSE